MPNYNSETGVAYGVIAGNTLDGDVLDELMCGNEAQNLTHMSAVKEARDQAEAEWAGIVSSVKVQAAGMRFDSPDHYEEWITNHITQMAGDLDHDDYIEAQLDKFNDQYEGDEEVFEGTYEGVKYHVSWLGGAPIVFIVESPHIVMAAGCSPCVPGAGDLDHVDPDNGTVECYDVPADWRHTE